MSISLFMVFFFFVGMIVKPTEGFKMELIHPNSVDSPTYLGNLTFTSKLNRLVAQAQNRAHWGANSLRPPLGGFGPQDDLLYYVKIGIGSFNYSKPSYKTYFLALDTGSSITWLQCEACKHKGNHCFRQVDPIFQNSKSYTFRPLTEHHNSCLPKQNYPTFNDKFLPYRITYTDGRHSNGQIACETFTFESDTDIPVVVENILFGCGFNQLGFLNKKPLVIAGILGLSRTAYSLQGQLDRSSGIGLNFSYCLPNLLEKGHKTTSYLRIGEDMSPYTNYRHTPMLAIGDSECYYIKVIDIIVNKRRLHLPSSVFDVHEDGTGGVFLDSGSSITAFINPAYIKLEKYLVELFANNPNYQRRRSSPRLCYDTKYPVSYKNLPTIEFMLQGGSLEFFPEQGFAVMKDEKQGSEYFCLMMKPDGSYTILGAYQQINHRFIYDIKHSTLWYKNDDCTRNP